MSSLVDQKNLDLCLAQAANPLDEDVNEEVISQLVHLMKDDKEKIGCVLRFFGHKIQSPQELEAMKALNVLQSLVKRSDKKFIEEVGKFRFLNEMIKVISPKYLAQRSPERVKRKIIELLYLWSIEHKHEPKIFEAYQMLKRQGIITSDPTHLLPNTTPSPPPPPRPKDEIWDNAENALMLKRLIQSGQPADRVAANKLIKILAQQADKKTVIKAKCQAELELARNNARLFAEVLANLTSSDCKNFTEKDLLDELYDSCKKLRPKLFKLAGEMPESEPLFEETLKVNDELTKVINEYDVAMQLVPQSNGNNHTVNSQINDNSCNLLLETSSASPNLLDISTPTHETASSCIVNGGASIMVPDSTDISFSGDDSLLSNHETNKDNLENSIATSAPVPNSSQNISELFEMFPKNETRDLVDAHVNYLKEILVPCMPKPPNAHISPQTSSFSASIPNNEINKSPKKSSCLDELENLMRLTLNAGPKLDGLSDSNIPLNSMRRTVNHPTLNKPNVPFMDALSESVELNSDSSEHLVPSSSIVSDVSPQSIADIFIPLESVEPGNRSPIVLVNENEIKSILNFGANQPRYGVSVAVLTTTNLSKKSICKIFFNITSSKGIRFKYQAPSATVLSPSNPFLPPPAITQVIIFAKTSPDRLEKCYFRLEYSIGSENFVKTGEVNI